MERLKPGPYTLREVRSPHAYEPAAALMFDVKPTASVQGVSLHDKPIEVAAAIDKRQEIAKPIAPHTRADGDGLNRAGAHDSDDGSFSYSLDYRNNSSTWVDEFTVEDSLDATASGVAELTGITTGRAHGDYDGRLNVWYRTNLDPGDGAGGSAANATLEDGHVNPWLHAPAVMDGIGKDGRAIDYEGWRLWEKDVPATESTFLPVSELSLESGETITGIRLEYGCVSKDFASRPGQWDNPDIKHRHDDWSPIPITHGPISDAAGGTVGAYASTLIHMRALPSYAGGSSIDNHANVSLYRNGGGKDLEAHDEDAVHQEAADVPSGPIINLDQTGAAPLLRTAAAIFVAGIVTAGYVWQRRRWRRVQTPGCSSLRFERVGGCRSLRDPIVATRQGEVARAAGAYANSLKRWKRRFR